MTGRVGGLEPILCSHLLRKVDGDLIELLGALNPDDWDRQTVAPQWRVRDVAAHLLDTCLRKLSMVRDGTFVEAVEIRSPSDVVALVNRLNREGVTVLRRLSPRVIIDLLKLACEQSAAFHESLEPFAPAMFAVSWAGEEKSLNWFDTARELTERWHHQQQIRLAVDRPGGMTPDVYYPVLDCFLRGLPHLFREVSGPPVGTAVVVKILGDCGGRWCLRRLESGWAFGHETTSGAAARVTIPQEIAWRLFTRGCDRDLANQQIEIAGDAMLGGKVLDLLAIVG